MLQELMETPRRKIWKRHICISGPGISNDKTKVNWGERESLIEIAFSLLILRERYQRMPETDGRSESWDRNVLHVTSCLEA
jgi:hypothetical protein